MESKLKAGSLIQGCSAHFEASSWGGLSGGRSEPSAQGKPPLQLDSTVSRWQFLGAALAHQERVPLATLDQDVVVNRSD